MSKETLLGLLPIIVPVLVTMITIVGNGWIQKYKTKGESEATKTTTKIAAEDSFRDDLIQHNRDLINLEKSYREELRQLDQRYRDHIEKLESKYDLVLQTVRNLQTENASLKLDNIKLANRIKELEQNQRGH